MTGTIWYHSHGAYTLGESSWEIYKKVISDLQWDIPGVMNLCYDIIVNRKEKDTQPETKGNSEMPQGIWSKTE